MNYEAIYRNLISRAAERAAPEVCERHHIIPRCLGGGDKPENIVPLTPEEHYLAHQLLVRLYPGHQGIAWAAIAMTAKGNGNKLYGWLRRQYSLTRKGMPRAWMRGQNNPAKSAAAREKISLSKRGIPRPPFSSEWIQNLSATHKALAKRPGYIPVGRRLGVPKKISEAFLGRRWITNGTKNCLARLIDGTVPDGWCFGRVPKT